MTDRHGRVRSGLAGSIPARSRRRRATLEALEPRVVMATFLVTSAGDDPQTTTFNNGTLRDAIHNSNQSTDTSINTINFAIDGGGPQTISLTADLGSISHPVVIDGTSQPGTAATINGIRQPLVGLTTTLPRLETGVIAPFTTGATIGLDVENPRTTIQGLAIGGFTYGVVMEGAGDRILSDNYLGLAPDGTTSVPNTVGVAAFFSDGNTIQGNVIAASSTAGVQITSSNTNQVLGNLIGTDPSGLVAVPNAIGVQILGGTSNTIGDGTAADRNIISGNTNAGIQLDVYVSGFVTQSSQNTILGNFIGTNVSGQASISNGDGIQILGGTGNTIGGTDPADRNIISGNSGSGVLIDVGFGDSGAVVQSNGNNILGNYIGTDVGGSARLGNSVGVQLNAAVSNRIGGTTVGSGNVISGNNQGLVIRSGTPRNTGAAVVASSNTIEGNFIGTDATGMLPVSNNYGVALLGTTLNTIGGDSAAARNVISGNAIAGILLGRGDIPSNSTDVPTDAQGNVVTGNYIGVAADGATALGNFAGVSLASGSNNSIGDGTAAGSNVIATNRGNGVEILAGSNNSVTRNSIYGNGGLGIAVPAGSNNGVVAPTLTQVTSNATSVQIQGTVTGAAGLYRVDLYATPAGGGNSSGRVYLGTQAVTVAADGTATPFAATLPGATPLAVGTLVTATLTGPTPDVTLPNGSTSNFSNAVAVIDPYLVTNTNDTGPGSLRQAIINVNNSPDGAAYTIRFAIPGTGVHTINVASELPPLLRTATIDGTTQPGWKANDLAVGDDAVLAVQISGVGIPADQSTVDGIVFAQPSTGVATPSVITGLDIVGFGSAAISTVEGSGASVRIVGNFLGIDPTGTVAQPNGSGMYLRTTGNIVGGADAASRNVISGNRSAGIVVTSLDGAANNNTILNNYVGTNAAGTAIVANSLDGIDIDGSGNVIRGNVVSGNSGNGISLLAGNPSDTALDVSLNTVAGNFIGTDPTGRVALRNSGVGVGITNAQQNTIGGATAADLNLIAGNGKGGVLIIGAAGEDAAGLNSILGNIIGTTLDGSTALANGGDGVALLGFASDNTIANNLISGNTGNGISLVARSLDGSVGVVQLTTITGNTIGTNLAGTASIANAGAGISLDGATANTIGSSTSGGANLISGNGGDGIAITGTGDAGRPASLNVVASNLIGTNRAGTAAIPNQGSGVALTGYASSNTIGGATFADGNLISGNGVLVAGDVNSNGDVVAPHAGISISGANASGNFVYANRIGTDEGGTHRLPNLFDGVAITDSSGNRVAGNLISGNGGDVTDEARALFPGGSTALAGAMSQQAAGVNISGTGARLNIVTGNLIGTDISGQFAVGNSLHGVVLGNGASINFIGGIAGPLDPTRATPDITSGLGNVISGNGNATYQGAGVFVYDGLLGDGTVVPTSNNVIQGNRIGTDAAGSVAIRANPAGDDAAHDGAFTGATVGVYLAASNNLVGGTAVGAANVISGNSALGVDIVGPTATGNTVQGNRIGTDAAGGGAIPNGVDGVLINGASNNTIGGSGVGEGNVIAGNGQFGVQIFGPTARGNVVRGNRLGIAAASKTPIPNGRGGLADSETPGLNTLGGTGAAANTGQARLFQVTNVVSTTGLDDAAPTATIASAATTGAAKRTKAHAKHAAVKVGKAHPTHRKAHAAKHSGG